MAYIYQFFSVVFNKEEKGYIKNLQNKQSDQKNECNYTINITE